MCVPLGPPLPHLLHCPIFLPTLAWNPSSLGIYVTIPGHLSHLVPLVCERTPSINFGIMKVMSTWLFVILTRYYHISSQRGGVSHACAGRRTGHEGGVGLVRPSRTHMWFSMGPIWVSIMRINKFLSLGTSIWQSFYFRYNLGFYIKQEPSYLGNNDRLVSIWYLTQTITWVCKDSLTLTSPLKINIWLAS